MKREERGNRKVREICRENRGEREKDQMKKREGEIGGRERETANGEKGKGKIEK